MRNLIMTGLSLKEAKRWCAAWEAEAARQHLRPDSPYFWDAGRGWIDAQRSFLDERPIPPRSVPARRARFSR